MRDLDIISQIMAGTMYKLNREQSTIKTNVINVIKVKKRYPPLSDEYHF